MDYIYLSAIAVAVIFLSIAIFQVLLSLGYPLGEYAMGGLYKVLPNKLRIISAFNAMLLIFMGFVFLHHANVFDVFRFLPTDILVWVITIFLGINSLANLVSRSKKERFVMTPLSSVAFVLCLYIAIS